GLAALAGFARGAGVVGDTLGGGLSWLARRHGLAANRVTAIGLVTADGELVRTDRDHEPELFWALRGGGGGFGVVTAMELSLVPLEDVYAGALFFPFERSAEVLQAWREWTATVPDEVTSVGRLMQFPATPGVPEMVRGRSFALVEAAFECAEADGAELLRPLRELRPELDTFTTIPPSALGYLHMDPERPVPGLSDHQLVGDLPAAAIDDLVAVAGPGSDSPLASVELRHTGGALARSAQGGGALATLAGSYCTYAVGVPSDAAPVTAIEAQLALVAGALAPWDAGRCPGLTERPAGAERFFGAETARRLEAVRAAVDPDGLFRADDPVIRA
ncbi:MAG: FAD-binding oxidoreductase, partial [Solirubrobacteraceae bacterium]